MCALAAVCVGALDGAASSQTGLANPTETGFHATVSTVAGSGSFGTIDGPAAQASFVYPSGVAAGLDGAVYVADAGAQRIRVIRGGRVSTVAGSSTIRARAGLWYIGGFRDGPALNAQFNDPTGVAVDADGRIFVADSDNHCVRLIDHGLVSTYAGSPEDRGSTDGPLAAARFDRPMSVAIDPKGGLYVADYGNGVRHIDASGNVTTVIATQTATGVAVSPGANHWVFAADRDSLRILRGGLVTIPSAGNRGPGSSSRTAMDADIGHPFMITAVDDERVFFTDEQTGAVRYVDVYDGTVRVIAGPHDEDMSNDSASFADGPAARAGLADAAGVTFDNRGRLLVADAGNRRVRLISGLNMRSALMPSVDLIPAETAPRGRFRIAVIGSSIVWTNTIWDTSIERALEDGLNDTGRKVWVQPIRMQATALHDSYTYLDEVLLPTHGADLVVLVLNDGMLQVEGPYWEDVIATRLPALNARLHAGGIRLVVAFHPMAWDYLGAAFPRLDRYTAGHEFVLDYGLTYDHMLHALRGTHVPMIDMWPEFEAWQRAPNHQPLYGTDDKHLTVAGREMMGRALAKDLSPYVK